MTKQHFIALADWIRSANSGMHEPDVYYTLDLIEDLADFLSHQNLRFNRQSWLDYVADTHGPNGRKRKESV